MKSEEEALTYLWVALKDVTVIDRFSHLTYLQRQIVFEETVNVTDDLRHWVQWMALQNLLSNEHHSVKNKRNCLMRLNFGQIASKTWKRKCHPFLSVENLYSVSGDRQGDTILIFCNQVDFSFQLNEKQAHGWFEFRTALKELHLRISPL